MFSMTRNMTQNPREGFPQKEVCQPLLGLAIDSFLLPWIVL